MASYRIVFIFFQLIFGSYAADAAAPSSNLEKRAAVRDLLQDRRYPGHVEHWTEPLEGTFLGEWKRLSIKDFLLQNSWVLDKETEPSLIEEGSQMSAAATLAQMQSIRDQLEAQLRKKKSDTAAPSSFPKDSTFHDQLEAQLQKKKSDTAAPSSFPKDSTSAKLSGAPTLKRVPGTPSLLEEDSTSAKLSGAPTLKRVPGTPSLLEEKVQARMRLMDGRASENVKDLDMVLGLKWSVNIWKTSRGAAWGEKAPRGTAIYGSYYDASQGTNSAAKNSHSGQDNEIAPPDCWDSSASENDVSSTSATTCQRFSIWVGGSRFRRTLGKKKWYGEGPRVDKFLNILHRCMNSNCDHCDCYVANDGYIHRRLMKTPANRVPVKFFREYAPDIMPSNLKMSEYDIRRSGYRKTIISDIQEDVPEAVSYLKEIAKMTKNQFNDLKNGLLDTNAGEVTLLASYESKLQSMFAHYREQLQGYVQRYTDTFDGEAGFTGTLQALRGTVGEEKNTIETNADDPPYSMAPSEPVPSKRNELVAQGAAINGAMDTVKGDAYQDLATVNHDMSENVADNNGHVASVTLWTDTLLSAISRLLSDTATAVDGDVAAAQGPVGDAMNQVQTSVKDLYGVVDPYQPADQLPAEVTGLLPQTIYRKQQQLDAKHVHIESLLAAKKAAVHAAIENTNAAALERISAKKQSLQDEDVNAAFLRVWDYLRQRTQTKVLPLIESLNRTWSGDESTNPRTPGLVDMYLNKNILGAAEALHGLHETKAEVVGDGTEKNGGLTALAQTAKRDLQAALSGVADNAAAAAEALANGQTAKKTAAKDARAEAAYGNIPSPTVYFAAGGQGFTAVEQSKKNTAQLLGDYQGALQSIQKKATSNEKGWQEQLGMQETQLAALVTLLQDGVEEKDATGMSEQELRTSAQNMFDQYLGQSSEMSEEMVGALRTAYADFSVFLSDFLKTVRGDKTDLLEKVSGLTEYLQGDLQNMESAGVEGVDLLLGVKKVMQDGMDAWNRQAGAFQNEVKTQNLQMAVFDETLKNFLSTDLYRASQMYERASGAMKHVTDDGQALVPKTEARLQAGQQNISLAADGLEGDLLTEIAASSRKSKVSYRMLKDLGNKILSASAEDIAGVWRRAQEIQHRLGEVNATALFAPLFQKIKQDRGLLHGTHFPSMTEYLGQEHDAVKAMVAHAVGMATGNIDTAASEGVKALTEAGRSIAGKLSGVADAVLAEARAKQGDVTAVVNEVEQLQFLLKQKIELTSEEQINQALALAYKYGLLEGDISDTAKMTDAERKALLLKVQQDYEGLGKALKGVAIGILQHTKPGVHALLGQTGQQVSHIEGWGEHVVWSDAEKVANAAAAAEGQYQTEKTVVSKGEQAWHNVMGNVDTLLTTGNQDVSASADALWKGGDEAVQEANHEGKDLSELGQGITNAVHLMEGQLQSMLDQIPAWINETMDGVNGQMEHFDHELNVVSTELTARDGILQEKLNRHVGAFGVNSTAIKDVWREIESDYKNLREEKSLHDRTALTSVEQEPLQQAQLFDVKRRERTELVTALLHAMRSTFETQVYAMERAQITTKNKFEQMKNNLARIYDASMTDAARQLAKVRDSDKHMQHLETKFDGVDKWRNEYVTNEKMWRDVVKGAFDTLNWNFTHMSDNLTQLEKLVEEEVQADTDAELSRDSAAIKSETAQEGDLVKGTGAQVSEEVSGAIGAHRAVSAADMDKLRNLESELANINNLKRPDDLEPSVWKALEQMKIIQKILNQLKDHERAKVDQQKLEVKSQIDNLASQVGHTTRWSLAELSNQTLVHLRDLAGSPISTLNATGVDQMLASGESLPDVFSVVHLRHQHLMRTLEQLRNRNLLKM